MPSSKKKPTASHTTKTRVATPDMTGLVDLTPEEVKGLSKPREGFEEQVELLLRLAAKHPQDLSSSGWDPAEVRARFERWQKLEVEQAAAKKAADAAAKRLEMVNETRALQASFVWRAMMDIYGRAQLSAKRNTAIRDGIQAFQKFMSVGPRKKAAGT